MIAFTSGSENAALMSFARAEDVVLKIQHQRAPREIL